MQANRQWLTTEFALSALWLPGLVSWSLLLNCWRITWRVDTGRLLLTVQPQMTSGVTDFDVWTWEILIFPSILQELCEELWMLVRSASPSWCHCFGYGATVVFFRLNEQYSCSDTHTRYSSVFMIVNGHKTSKHPTQSQICSSQTLLQPPKYN